MITLPVVAANIVEGVENVDRRLLEMGDVYRLDGRQKFVAIVAPSTLPYLVAGMKVGFGLALKVSVVAEIFGVTSGIGYIMNYSREILATQMVFVWALVMILVMMATDKLVFDAVSRRVARWRRSSPSRAWATTSPSPSSTGYRSRWRRGGFLA